ncbi:PREDICTED: uncharacterized protein LOC108609457 [Drosophila arizonae]|uniref:Uncharacterized protein LOC108609457 n=1 Tax=Drosophila arizonae TaxID=7263 RepID=A0ABM1NNY0_DROAR|nr:PREDICTED: uncharacterized protein LOC108609457 [Drosophila arizonae]
MEKLKAKRQPETNKAPIQSLAQTQTPTPTQTHAHAYANAVANPFKRPMNTLQKQWYRVLLARRVGFGQRPQPSEKEPTYADICHRRYVAAFRRYNERFRWEMGMHEQMQRCAIDAMRVHRTFSITTLWLPLHSKREINSTLETLEKVLTVKERRRLEEILKRLESQRTRRF